MDKDLKRLNDSQWINDNIIDFYFKWIFYLFLFLYRYVLEQKNLWFSKNQVQLYSVHFWIKLNKVFFKKKLFLF